MTDESTDEAETTDDEGGDRPLAGAAAQSALKKERKARQEAERANKDLADRLKALEDQNLSEAERLRNENETLKRERDEEHTRSESERTQRQRTDMVRKAAAKENFADADDIVALLRGLGSLDDIESESEAARVVKALAKDKPHLLRQGDAPDVTKPGIERVLKDGLPNQDQSGKPLQQPQGDFVPPLVLAAMTDDEQRALKSSNPSRYWRSIEALNGGSATTHTVV